MEETTLTSENITALVNAPKQFLALNLSDERTLKQMAMEIVNYALTENKSFEMDLFFRQMEKLKKLVDPSIKDYALKEARMWAGGEKEFTHNGIKITLCHTYTKYDYSNCGHPGWMRYNQEEQAAKASRESIEAELKVMQNKRTELDEESGEVITIYPPDKIQTEGYKTELPKK